MCLPPAVPTNTTGAVNTSPRAIGIETIPKPDPTIVLPPKIGVGAK